MAKHLHVRIVTLEKVIISDRYISATVPAVTGELTILAGHVPIVTPIKSGEIILKTEKGQNTSLSISSGILEVRPNFGIVILADRAERAEHIDLERAEKAKKRVENLMEERKHEVDFDYAMLQSMLGKEISRINVAKRYRRNKKTFSTK